MNMSPVYRRKMKGYNTYLNHRNEWLVELKKPKSFT